MTKRSQYRMLPAYLIGFGGLILTSYVFPGWKAPADGLLVGFLGVLGVAVLLAAVWKNATPKLIWGSAFASMAMASVIAYFCVSEPWRGFAYGIWAGLILWPLLKLAGKLWPGLSRKSTP